MRVDLILIIAAIAVSGCLTGPPSPDDGAGPLRHLDPYRGCDLLLPSGEPDPCTDEAERITATAGRPPMDWICIWHHAGAGLFWNPVLDEHAFQIQVTEMYDPSLTWFFVETEAEERLLLVERDDNEYWFPIGHVPGDQLFYSYLASRPIVTTNDSALASAEIEYLWSVYEKYPWLNLRFNLPDGQYVFSANRELPGGGYSAGDVYFEEPEFFLGFRLPLFAAGSIGEPGNPRVPQGCTMA